MQRKVNKQRKGGNFSFINNALTQGDLKETGWNVLHPLYNKNHD